MLKTNMTLQALFLHGPFSCWARATLTPWTVNGVGEKGARHLADALKVNTTLDTLNLCSACDACAPFLADDLRKSTKLAPRARGTLRTH
jgi:hypothetical protein